MAVISIKKTEKKTSNSITLSDFKMLSRCAHMHLDPPHTNSIIWEKND